MTLARWHGTPPPGTAERMRIYAREAPALAERAARRALASAGIQASEIRHLIFVTCTGFSAPGPELVLAGALGLPASVERTVVGYMGCHGALNGLRVAQRSIVATGQLALVVCVELSSVHVQPDAERGSLVAASLFGDGAAAAVLGPAEPVGGCGALIDLGSGASLIDHAQRDAMTWTIGDTGFRMHLSPELPRAIGDTLREFVDGFGLGTPDPGALCVHPGGPAILSQVESCLGLARGALVHSRAALREHGNLSSATLLFVLERALPSMREGASGLLLGFGPGLALEGLAFTRTARAAPQIHRFAAAVAQ